MHRPPEDEIVTLTADAYALFPDVRRSDTPACAHCISRARQRRLMRGRREDIPHEDVAFYAFKAMTTWGDATLYRAMWPRIVECALSKHGPGWPGLSERVIAGKLLMADVMSWPAARRETVDRFFMLAVARAVAQADECTFKVENVVRQGARVVRHPSILGRSDPRPRSEYAPAR